MTSSAFSEIGRDAFGETLDGCLKAVKWKVTEGRAPSEPPTPPPRCVNCGKAFFAEESLRENEVLSDATIRNVGCNPGSCASVGISPSQRDRTGWPVASGSAE